VSTYLQFQVTKLTCITVSLSHHETESYQMIKQMLSPRFDLEMYYVMPQKELKAE
jgi:hypothetical protein